MVKITGWKELEKELKKLEKKVNDVSKTKSLTFDELFNDKFMKTNTKFNNIEDFFEKSPFELKTQEDLEQVNEKELDKYVKVNSKFNSWQSMKDTAGVEWTKKELGM